MDDCHTGPGMSHCVELPPGSTHTSCTANRVVGIHSIDDHQIGVVGVVAVEQTNQSSPTNHRPHKSARRDLPSHLTRVSRKHHDGGGYGVAEAVSDLVHVRYH